MKISDSCLISQYQKGDEQALEKLIQKHQQDLFSFIFYKNHHQTKRRKIHRGGQIHPLG